MKRRIFGMTSLLALGAVLLTGLLLLYAVYQSDTRVMQERIRSDAELIAYGLAAGGEAYLARLPMEAPQSCRVTVIGREGDVQYDSQALPEDMGNHSDRPEVKAVLDGAPSASSVRQSRTLGRRTYYYALNLGGGAVLRVSMESKDALSTVAALLPAFLLVAGLTLLLCLLGARWIADSITVPLNRLDLAHPEENEAYEELTPLLSRMAQQNRAIRQQMGRLSAKQAEFATLSENMNEGLLLLDANAAIVSINSSARSLLGGSPEREYIGRHFLQLSRDGALEQLIEGALHGGRASDTMPFSGRQHRVFANPVQVDGENRGALVLFLDVTEQLHADQMRREFSANVSHELKTPLTSISGYAEMLAGGMVKPEDIRTFAGRIYNEAGRLLTLIEDIMKLSSLDEGVTVPGREAVDLFALARQTADRLALTAREQGVTVGVHGASVVVYGSPTMLGELAFNLAENAVKYNREGGQVELAAEDGPAGPTLTVRDTGIGIPADCIGRIFERFFRVDKSRSKETGGTGLGLSIVKHIALLHGAHIEVTSREEAGSCIRVTFPREAK